MALLISQVGGWLKSLRIAVITVCALFTLSLVTSMTPADEVEELSITEADGAYSLRVVSVLDAPVEYVYDVITDYKHAYRINPTITEVEILPSDRDQVVRVRNLSEHWVGPFCFKIDWVGDIEEPRDGYLKVKTIPELSSFKSGSAVWELRSQGERTWVLHESILKPDFFMPPVIGNHIMRKQMKEDTLDTFNRIECYAKVMFDMDMENETERMNNVLKEGKDCINTQDKSAHLSLETK
ncbi:MAG: SRPBCC family protein [Gammaproteobacteria bacterium]